MPLAYIPSPPRSSWHLGPLPIRAQALCVVAGILIAIWIADRRYRAAGGSRGVIVDIAAWAVPAGLIPAVIGALLVQADGGAWHVIRTWDAVIGFPGAVALGALAAWLVCRRLRVWQYEQPGPRIAAVTGQGVAPSPRVGQRLRLVPVAAAAAPAIVFGEAVAAAGGWFSQQGYGRPSSLWWAVAISPAHRPTGYENFPTFEPIFLYQALWAATTGAALVWAARRFALRGDCLFALAAAAYAAGGFGMFWLGIGHLPVILGLRAGELGDAVVFIAAAAYLARIWRRRTKPFQPAQKPALERDSSVM